ncbi:MAG: hypothetical protein NC253_15800 [Ruminococcus sp.]|nr:hypothetical protein [Ruminococcus sp.]MCM1382780.1 hypothetical protein [Muribaculaceae bacterium]
MNQVLKDKYGNKIAEIQVVGSQQVIMDKYGSKLGSFDGKFTRDKYGNKIGEGNLLTTLIK